MNKRRKRIAEAQQVLQELGMPRAQRNDRTALCLLALLNLSPNKQWQEAEQPKLGIRAILDFARQVYGIKYAENTRESVRKHSIKPMVAAGLVRHNPDMPDRPINSSGNCYQVDAQALALLQKFGTGEWMDSLNTFLKTHKTLAEEYARVREIARVPVQVKPDQQIALSAGAHSDLIRAIIQEFGPRFLPGAELVYVGDTGAKWGYFDEPLLTSLGVQVDPHGKMPDVVLYDRRRNWLVLVEAVASSGPVDSGRHLELAKLFQSSSAGLVYVTAFPDRGPIFRKFLAIVAWETEVWCAGDPTHLIHFNGERFLGPHNTFP